MNMRELRRAAIRTCAYTHLKVKLLAKGGISGLRLASSLWREAKALGVKLSAQAADLKNSTAEQLEPIVLPFLEKVTELVAKYWKEPVLLVLRNDKTVEKFAKFTYACLPEPVRSVVTRKTFIAGCKHCRALLVAKLEFGLDRERQCEAPPSITPEALFPEVLHTAEVVSTNVWQHDAVRAYSSKRAPSDEVCGAGSACQK